VDQLRHERAGEPLRDRRVQSSEELGVDRSDTHNLARRPCGRRHPMQQAFLPCPIFCRVTGQA
jgi:hypothetical protein